MPVSGSPFMTSPLCPDARFKPLPRILSPVSVLPALTLFLSADTGFANLTASVTLPCYLLTITLRSRNSVNLILSRTLKRGSCVCCWWFHAEGLPERPINLLKLSSCVQLKFRVF
ncbi:hypothetical protein ATANTOWER_023893 [Ataeniobius toweri]|uniref:Uncharacterized protein n=1 Tax=Ataeniobius toweri TaxID=208326 RepID=A0ABU7A2X1_9TELE|nr:hypothetical protein [Ataeniobius toweri]